MMLHLLRLSLLLVLLTDRNVPLVKATDYVEECGEDKCCILVGATNEINNKLDKHAIQMKANLEKQLEEQRKNLEELKARLDQTAKDISTQLEKQSADLLSHDERLQAHDSWQRNVSQLSKCKEAEVSCVAELRPRDCSEVRSNGYNVSGIYRVYPGSEDTRIEADVYCDFKTPGQSWLVFQRRKDGSVNFEQNWKEYERGFGNLEGEFWLGNEKLSLLTLNRKYKLRIELEDFEGGKRYAEYSIFSVKSATDKYRLTVGRYSGNAGDSLTLHNGMQFTTKDVDNDEWSGNCAVTYRGAWWHKACHYANLNGAYLRGPHTTYADGIEWHGWRGHYYSYKTTEMKITAI